MVSRTNLIIDTGYDLRIFLSIEAADGNTVISQIRRAGLQPVPHSITGADDETQFSVGMKQGVETVKVLATVPADREDLSTQVVRGIRSGFEICAERVREKIRAEFTDEEAAELERRLGLRTISEQQEDLHRLRTTASGLLR